jgi:hypothetical protein
MSNKASDNRGIKESLRRITERPSNIEIERGLETLGQVMDNQFRVPIIGWRFGVDSLAGLIPGVGDTATSLVSLYILGSAVRYRVPKITILRMATNVALDYTLGSVPVVGDLFDAWWKSNTRNINLIRERATASPKDAKGGRTGDWLFVGAIMLVLIGLLVGSIAVIYLTLRWLVSQF